MPRPRVRQISSPDHVTELPGFRVDSVDLGDATVGYCRFEAGWRWSRDMAPMLKAATCPMRHLGYCLSGHMHVVMDDGQELEIGPDSAFEIPPGHDKWVVGDETWTAIEWGGTQRASAAATADSGAATLATVLLTDIVDSTATAASLGDGAWRDLLAAHNLRMREALNLFRGREIATTGDGILAVFDSPTRAVRCAAAMVAAIEDLGLSVRVGVHTGELEYVGEDVRGLAVHTAARVMALAPANQVLVSSSTAALLDASTRLQDAGTHLLKGLPQPTRLYRLLPPSSP
jgi:class 3 adenylate cyclase